MQTLKTLSLLLILAMPLSTFAQKKAKKTHKTQKSEKVVTNRQVPGMVNQHSVGIGLGQTFLLGDFEELGNDRITADLLYSYSASYTFDILVNAHYSTHRQQNQEVKLFGSSVSIRGKAFQMDSFAPFLAGGLGFYRPTIIRGTANGPLESEGQMVFGWNLGAGADLRLSPKMTIGVLGQLHNPFDVEQDLMKEVEGSYFKLLMTLLYTFS